MTVFAIRRGLSGLIGPGRGGLGLGGGGLSRGGLVLAGGGFGLAGGIGLTSSGAAGALARGGLIVLTGMIGIVFLIAHSALAKWAARALRRLSRPATRRTRPGTSRISATLPLPRMVKPLIPSRPANTSPSGRMTVWNSPIR